MINRSFIKSSLIYTLAGALPMASAVILLPFYVLYLPTDVYGALTICLTFSVLIQVIVTYSFDTSIYIHYHELKDRPDKLASFISSSFIFMLGLSLAVGLILSASGQFIFATALPTSKISFYPYGLIATGLGIFQAIFKVHGNLLQIREKPQTFLWSNVVSFALVAIATIVGLKLFPQTLVGPLGGRLLAGSLATVWVLFRIFREFGIHIKSPWQQTSFSFNAYTFVYQLQQWTINSFDRFLILFFLPSKSSLASVGVYEFAIKCLVPVELLLNGLNASINPKVIKLISQQDQKKSTVEINRYFYGSISVIMLVLCLSIIAVPIAITLFVKKNGYVQAVQYIPYIAIIFIFKTVRLYFVVPYSILKKMKRLMTVNFFTSAFKIGTMIVLMLQWQLYGVIASSMITFAIEMLLLWYYLKDDYAMKFNVYKLLVIPFLLFLVIIVTEPIVGVRYPLPTHAAYGLLCVTSLWFAYRNEIKSLDLSKLIK